MNKSIIAAGLALAWVPTTVFAQGLGLPVAEDAAPGEPDAWWTTVGVVLGDHVNLYGARAAYQATPDLLVFGDAGIMDPDFAGSGLAIQAGGIHALKLDSPVDLGLRATVFAAFPSQVDTYGVSGGLLASTTVSSADALTLYGYAGLVYARSKVTVGIPLLGRRSTTTSDTELALTLGALFQVRSDLSLFAELSHVDNTFVAAGARVAF